MSNVKDQLICYKSISSDIVIYIDIFWHFYVLTMWSRLQYVTGLTQIFFVELFDNQKLLSQPYNIHIITACLVRSSEAQIFLFSSSQLSFNHGPKRGIQDTRQIVDGKTNDIENNDKKGGYKPLT